MTYKNIHEFKCDFCKKTCKSETSLLPLGWVVVHENFEDSTTKSEYFCTREHLKEYCGFGTGRRISKASRN